MNAPIPPLDFIKHADAEVSLADVAAQLRAGTIVPYLGPGLAEVQKPAAPMNPEALAAFFGTKVALPRRAKGNAWAAAQHIESYKHRSTVTALMSEALALTGKEKVLEIGTGSGYQAAVLAELGVEVYTVEIIPELAEHARSVLKAEGYGKVHVLTGDGYKGWPEYSPFDAIIVTCAPDNVPQTLVDQLKDGGQMILPIGSLAQRLVILKKKGGRVEQDDDIFVRFVPMVHERNT